MKKEARTLTGEQIELHLQHLLREERS
jgi:hypothetical protein